MSTVAATPVRPTRVRATVLVSGAVLGLCLVAVGPSPLGLVLAGGAAVLAWLAMLDLEYQLVPNRVVLPAAGAVLILASALEPSDAPARLLAAFGAAAFLLVAAVVRPGAMGMGDVKLAGLVGAVCGAAVLSAFVVAFLALAVTGLLLVVRSGRDALKQQLPLVPFLALGTVFALVAYGA